MILSAAQFAHIRSVRRVHKPSGWYARGGLVLAVLKLSLISQMLSGECRVRFLRKS